MNLIWTTQKIIYKFGMGKYSAKSQRPYATKKKDDNICDTKYEPCNKGVKVSPPKIDPCSPEGKRRIPGCMPFTENEPIKNTFYACGKQDEACRQSQLEGGSCAPKKERRGPSRCRSLDRKKPKQEQVCIMTPCDEDKNKKK